MNHKMHEQYDAVVMSLSAIMHMASNPYHYWKDLGQMIQGENLDESDKAMFKESRDRCEKVMQGVCERLDAVMQYIGDCNNAVDAVDEHGLTDAAFAQMRRAMGEVEGNEP